MTQTAEDKMQLLFALRSSGVTDKAVLSVIEKIDRSKFVTGIFADRAYEDTPLPIKCGQTISQPSVVGLMTQALALTDRDKVLEIGTGSGYQTAILSRLSRRVYTMDRHTDLVLQASKLFEAQRYSNVTTLLGDGSLGWPAQAPFDKIIVTAASEDLPTALLQQLKIGGIMVVPVGQSDNMQTLVKVKKSDTGYEYEELRSVRFVPLVEGLAKKIA